MEDRSQEGRKHIFAINGSPEFLNIVRELFQEEAYNVTTTNFVPNSFDQTQWRSEAVDAECVGTHSRRTHLAIGRTHRRSAAPSHRSSRGIHSPHPGR